MKNLDPDLPDKPKGRWDISYYDMEYGAIRREYCRGEKLHNRVDELRLDNNKYIQCVNQPSPGINGTAPID